MARHTTYKKFYTRLRREIGEQGSLAGEYTTDSPEVKVQWATDKGTIKRVVDDSIMRDPGAAAGLGAGMKREYQERPRLDRH